MPNTLFGLTALPLTADLSPMTRWTTWQSAQAQSELPQALSNHLAYLKDQDRRYQLTDLDAFINPPNHQWIEDGEQWKTVADFWENGGECASFALAKYVALTELGWTDHAFVLVEIAGIGAHAVLAVPFEGETLILDSRTDDPDGVPMIKSDTEITNYTPVYSICAAGWRLYEASEPVRPA